MIEAAMGLALLLVIFWALINRQRHRESRDAMVRLGSYMNVFAYNSEILLQDNINNAERAARILRKAQERKPDAVHYDEVQAIQELGYSYNTGLSIAANLAVLSAVIRALKG